ncbi:unnamed protein product [Dicrocoelium dendriticum]|nr:unnamed protein product [Dicrocoelium dendriticum]
MDEFHSQIESFFLRAVEQMAPINIDSFPKGFPTEAEKSHPVQPLFLLSSSPIKLFSSQIAPRSPFATEPESDYPIVSNSCSSDCTSNVTREPQSTHFVYPSKEQILTELQPESCLSTQLHSTHLPDDNVHTCFRLTQEFEESMSQFNLTQLLDFTDDHPFNPTGPHIPSVAESSQTSCPKLISSLSAATPLNEISTTTVLDSCIIASARPCALQADFECASATRVPAFVTAGGRRISSPKSEALLKARSLFSDVLEDECATSSTEANADLHVSVAETALFSAPQAAIGPASATGMPAFVTAGGRRISPPKSEALLKARSLFSDVLEDECATSSTEANADLHVSVAETALFSAPQAAIGPASATGMPAFVTAGGRRISPPKSEALLKARSLFSDVLEDECATSSTEANADLHVSVAETPLFSAPQAAIGPASATGMPAFVTAGGRRISPPKSEALLKARSLFSDVLKDECAISSTEANADLHVSVAETALFSAPQAAIGPASATGMPAFVTAGGRRISSPKSEALLKARSLFSDVLEDECVTASTEANAGLHVSIAETPLFSAPQVAIGPASTTRMPAFVTAGGRRISSPKSEALLKARSLFSDVLEDECVTASTEANAGLHVSIAETPLFSAPQVAIGPASTTRMPAFVTAGGRRISSPKSEALLKARSLLPDVHEGAFNDWHMFPTEIGNSAPSIRSHHSLFQESSDSSLISLANEISILETPLGMRLAYPEKEITLIQGTHMNLHPSSNRGVQYLNQSTLSKSNITEDNPPLATNLSVLSGDAVNLNSSHPTSTHGGNVVDPSHDESSWKASYIAEEISICTSKDSTRQTQPDRYVLTGFNQTSGPPLHPSSTAGLEHSKQLCETDGDALVSPLDSHTETTERIAVFGEKLDFTGSPLTHHVLSMVTYSGFGAGPTSFQNSDAPTSVPLPQNEGPNESRSPGSLVNEGSVHEFPIGNEKFASDPDLDCVPTSPRSPEFPNVSKLSTEIVLGVDEPDSLNLLMEDSQFQESAPTLLWNHGLAKTDRR